MVFKDWDIESYLIEEIQASWITICLSNSWSLTLNIYNPHMTLFQFLIIPILWALALIGKQLYEIWHTGRRQRIENLSSLPRRKFELLVATRLRQKGRKHIQVGKGKADGGRDIRATSNGVPHLIQCKCYKPQVSIGVKTVRELFGVLKATEQHGVGVICTTGKFTKAAKKFATETGIKLWTGEILA